MSGKNVDRVLILCTLRFSSNLGDGVIGDCLEHLIRGASPDRSVVHLDMAGRQGFASPDKATDGFITKIAKRLFFLVPKPLRPLVTLLAWPVVFRPRLDRAWEGMGVHEPADLVFGGGQMLSDLALNFPLKFRHVVQRASAASARIAVSGVGVSASWSVLGRHLFRKALCRPEVRSVSVRDLRSCARLEAQIPSLSGKVKVTVDPGVWAGEVYGIDQDQEASDSLLIGLVVTEPTELAAYAEAGAPFSEERLLSFWSELAGTLTAQGHRILLFTNGATEDEAFLDRLAGRLKLNDIAFVRRPRALRPAGLAQHFRGLNAVVSHRLHANIIALSCAIPSVALIWDDKVISFAEAAGREKWCLAPRATAYEAAALAVEAARAGVDLKVLEELKSRALCDVRQMLASLARDRG